MKLARTRRTGRTGFTLIELLVVIAIIAILAGLITSAVMKLLGKGPIVQNMNDIRQLETGVADFRRDFKLQAGSFPSRIKLCENLGYYNTNNQLDLDSVNFLQRLWPAIGRPDASTGRVTWANPGIDWNGNGRIDAANSGGSVILEGDQCLVFFLGGIPTTAGGTNGTLGFSTSQHNPAAAGGTRNGPYFTFDSGRLYQRPDPTTGKTNGFFSYYDVYKKSPYLYFSSYQRRNGYNRYAALYGSDCATVYRDPTLSSPNVNGNFGVWPYAEYIHPTDQTQSRYQKPDGFQIISAGADYKFGPGTVISINGNNWSGSRLWSTSTAAAIAPNGRDDQSNFSGSLLGVPE